ncbi:family 12 glycoside hydrolase [Cryphonectria parasitica EP155]|uniref:Family 12 glycoside hydrolase n=1 Tax=Cryphonectria parasitica (strain ATCC 38755 / EP155) TaxID=660469 RepID=A0A9P4YA65_CRYP1|nr:family 12 glycoside hydrolase [Cryphonectria parasitica EP155]KAF3769762.1 family 12 glycoside hydrolase [Cryphonectria parasitica EP155]
MKFAAGLLPLALAGAASAKTTRPGHKERSTETCDQWGEIETGSYIVYNDLWGEADATSGSQCTTVTAVTNGIIEWSTSWTWAGGSSDVKSFADVSLVFTPTELSALSDIQAVWEWSYSGTSIDADVAFDTFLSSSCSSTTDEYEVMIWLAALGGAGPISSTGATIATPSIDGYTWNLWYGLNGATKVYSFVAPSEITSFDGNLLSFFDYLVDYEGVSSSSCLIDIQAGTEPFTGTSATLKSNYYVTI